MTLIATGTLTIDIARASKGRAVTLPRTFNYYSGKESMRQTGFSDTSWGKATRAYAVSARGLTNKKFDNIVQEASKYIVIKSNRARKKATDAEVIEIIDVDDDDERACLVDVSDGDDYCKSYFTHSIHH